MKFVPASDRSLLVVLGDGICVETNARVHLLSGLIQDAPGVTSQSPGYSSLLVRFDPLIVTHEELEAMIKSAPLEGRKAAAPHVVEIPVHYDGPDIDEVGAGHSLSREAVIEAHSSTVYHAYFAGFIPGFAYLGEVPPAIATPRRATPRREVPAGSVGIAGTQTGVYPRSTPGGWNLIGFTTAVMFDAEQGGPLIWPGDQVRFIPVL